MKEIVGRRPLDRRKTVTRPGVLLHLGRKDESGATGQRSSGTSTIVGAADAVSAASSPPRFATRR
jgi:hypothetical protein